MYVNNHIRIYTKYNRHDGNAPTFYGMFSLIFCMSLFTFPKSHKQNVCLLQILQYLRNLDFAVGHHFDMSLYFSVPTTSKSV